ncbi:hypothetical protein KQX54_006324 [Cotesia glomerata]|uniref:Uncharacterized protein n=1 Tax=Cotesia glomerata TaxID=32391 RepID=A0AAV7I7F3_COTGL|nr:hypothetical protein KQX54_006324 [Cotesia glomerata]
MLNKTPAKFLHDLVEKVILRIGMTSPDKTRLSTLRVTDRRKSGLDDGGWSYQPVVWKLETLPGGSASGSGSG